MKIKQEIDWKAFIGQHDMHWTHAPSSWKEAPFLGNGLMGIQVYHGLDGKVLHIDLGRSDVFDNREGDSIANVANDVGFNTPRLPIGYFEIGYLGELQSCEMHLNIYHAVLTGVLSTSLGRISFQFLVHATEMLVVGSYQCEQGEINAKMQFKPKKAVSPRHQYGMDNKQDFRCSSNYVEYTDAEVFGDDNEGYSLQKISKGFGIVTAWKTDLDEKGKRIYIHVDQNHTDHMSSIVAYVNKCWDFQKLWQIHCEWWEEYYPRSFVSIPNKRLESFYWLQIYKLACVTREGGPIIDNQGPWLQETPWPAIWWNLNVQLSYWPIYTSNRLELSQSLSNALKRNLQNLIENVPEAYQHDSAGIGTVSTQALKARVNKAGTDPINGFRELGNLTWVMHNCYLYYRMTMDDSYLEEIIYPILTRCVNYYVHFMWKDSEGKWHIQATSSPEYGKDCEDCNYDLALLRWGCQVLIESVRRLRMKDDKIELWQDILQHLTDFPQDENGYMIGKDLPYSYSHRHFSHLLMFYPLFLITPDEEENRLLMKKSLEWWWSKPEAMAGFSCTVGALLASALHDGDEAFRYLTLLWDEKLLKNTLYMEDGPVIETPLSGAQSIHEFLLQSHNEMIRIFPALPSTWKEAAFDGLCAQGGFLVSARLQNGITQYILVKSLAGEPCTLWIKDVEQMDLSDERINMKTGDTIVVNLQKGEEILIRSRNLLGVPSMEPCYYTEEIEYNYGLPS